MRKLIHISLSFLLLAATTGVTVSRHICGGSTYDKALYKEAEKCHGDHTGDMKGCCDDETEQHKVEDNFQQSYIVNVDYFPQLSFIIPELFQIRFDHIQTGLDLLRINSPPPALTGKQIVVIAQAFLL